MHAGETKIQAIIDSTRQYVIPLFQRPYSWESPQWTTLWQDLAELCEEEQPRNHFIGSIVTMPSKSVPEGVTKYILIDGQQRLTTLLILLAVVRDKARKQPDKLADKIDERRRDEHRFHPVAGRIRHCASGSHGRVHRGGRLLPKK